MLKKIANQKSKKYIYDESLNRLRRILKSTANTSIKNWEIVRSFLSYRSAKQNFIIHQYGTIEKSARFITKGVVKIVCHCDIPYVFDFRERGQFLCDAVSLNNHIKSSFTFETISECEWLELNANELMQQNLDFSKMFWNIAVNQLQKGYEKSTALRLNNAYERYDKFCEENPNIIKHAKLGDIASYLNIAPQSLSRIRRKNSKKQLRSL